MMIELDRKQQLVILILVGAVLFGAGFRCAQVKERAARESRPVLESKEEEEVKDLLVHVAGAVAKPGVYRMPQGSRVIDAVNRAEPTEDALLDSLKLAAPLIDGQTVPIPAKSSNQPGTPGGSTGPAAAAQPAGAATAGGLVNINTADLTQLDTLPGIGPALAGRIIQYRETYGPFKSIEEIKNVSGIGDKNFENLKDRITVY